MARLARVLVLSLVVGTALTQQQQQQQQQPAAGVAELDNTPEEPLTVEEAIEEKAEEEGAVVTENADGSTTVHWAHAPQQESDGQAESQAADEPAADDSSPAADATAAASADASSTEKLGTAGPGRGRSSNPRDRNRKRRGGKGNKRCKVPGCSVCTRADRTVCETCRRGFALNGEGKCDACPAGCSACKTKDTCETCKAGYTMRDGVCMSCASHCLKCDIAGPGGCNECGPRRMLQVSLEVHGEGEVHKCLPCGDGCSKCSVEEGCTQCDALFSLLPHGEGCYFSFGKIAMIFIFILGMLGCCLFACVEEDRGGSAYDAYRQQYGKDRHPNGSWMQGKKYDDGTRVVSQSRSDMGNGSGGQMRQRGRAEESPSREPIKIFTPMAPAPPVMQEAAVPAGLTGRYHAMPGYE